MTDEPKNEWDVIAEIIDGGAVWRRYGDGKIVTTAKGEMPDDALARSEKEGKHE
jgi:hypothetical protein